MVDPQLLRRPYADRGPTRIGQAAQVGPEGYLSWPAMPSRTAAAPASPRVRTSSLRKIAETWRATVLSERKRCMAALELPYVNLADALAICFLMRRRDDTDFERAAVRWLARLSLERPEITLAELRDAVDALRDLRSGQARAKLAALGARLRLPDVVRVLRS
jgi:hypothetical protein